MCKFLGISRSTYYYESKPKVQPTILENAVIRIFKDSKNTTEQEKSKLN